MGAGRAILRPEVPDDLLEITQYLGERDPSVAIRFAQAVPDTLEDILRFPDVGSPRYFQDPDLAGIRSWRVRGFKKYLIFYKPIEEGIVVLAILHGARDIPANLRLRH